MSKKIHEVDSMVLRALATGPKTHAQLVPHMGMSRETIRQALVRLKLSGKVVGHDGIFHLAEVSKAA